MCKVPCATGLCLLKDPLVVKTCCPGKNLYEMFHKMLGRCRMGILTVAAVWGAFTRKNSYRFHRLGWAAFFMEGKKSQQKNRVVYYNKSSKDIGTLLGLCSLGEHQMQKQSLMGFFGWCSCVQSLLICHL